MAIEDNIVDCYCGTKLLVTPDDLAAGFKWCTKKGCSCADGVGGPLPIIKCECGKAFRHRKTGHNCPSVRYARIVYGKSGGGPEWIVHPNWQTLKEFRKLLKEYDAMRWDFKWE